MNTEEDKVQWLSKHPLVKSHIENDLKQFCEGTSILTRLETLVNVVQDLVKRVEKLEER